MLANVSARTTVLHRSGDRAVRVEAGRFLAAKIPGARFIEIDGDDHWFWVGDQQPLLNSISAFARRA